MSFVFYTGEPASGVKVKISNASGGSATSFTSDSNGTIDIGSLSLEDWIDVEASYPLHHTMVLTEIPRTILEQRLEFTMAPIRMDVTGQVVSGGDLPPPPPDLPPGGTLTIEQAVAQYEGDTTLVEDDDIRWAIQLWITGAEVPDTGGATINDAQVRQLELPRFRGHCKT